ncbi:putative protein BRANCHLESS TRICHOME [Helianthus annuus]|uniref:Uncharacterized protein n=1 Tax=Helianthus annuus TaxID=4232 RepID=A0A251TIG5_HELAN|nr:uncharacterized protein At5g41620 [Helianthus annuus]KAF5800847.1 hypothetical protein HanXRQr2_Chr06g0241321 [Helianthus annuus]KAJ0559222.1 putative protein BRANCHLESS TRICHOME [Helianthus annuus]KAJ0565133.1 putative protein BRANCHLESS TRICHOME [Helianthus annuus]KAJ0572160.1 putative protein BRANCHLESS TRICHOME [Helianthus annuus]KAJ0736627.1 putative protein BRANCHLESS TRICHOME [Helianthus annuus]
MKKWVEEEKNPPPKKQQTLVKKIAAYQRGEQFTPVLPYPLQITNCCAQDSNGGAQDSHFINNPDLYLTVALPPHVSARKLAASVWELHQYNLPFANMHQGGGSRRSHRYLQPNHHHHHHLLEDNPELGNAGSLRRHVAASLTQHHRAIQRTHNAVRAVSPSSYGSSSMEVAPYNAAVTPTSSVEFRGGNGETSYTLKTSTELLKVLNRIWSLEEQHAANITLVKALKRELDLARSKIKELARDRQSDRHEMEHLMKKINEDKQGHTNATIQSVRDELEGERKLRKRSETLHRKLAQELYETKTSLTNALKDLEKEKKSRVLLEDLCDEFAWGIKSYEQELHALKHINPDRGNGSNFRSTRDGMILHISESWLDQRMQMKQETTLTKKSVVEQLSSEIEAFIEAKRKGAQKAGSGSVSVVGPTARRRHSLESIPTNLAASAPPNDDDDGVSSDGADSPCFELDKPDARGKDDIVNTTTKAILGEEHGKAEENHTKVKEDEVGLNSKYLDNLLKNHFLLTAKEFDDSNNKPVWKSHPSPVRRWTTTLPDEDIESSSKLQTESKVQTTLKSKPHEARTRGHRSGSRAKK